MMRRISVISLLIMLAIGALAAGLNTIELNDEWKAKIEKLAPEKSTVQPLKKHNALIFSEMTGFKHWVTPHTAEVVKILGKKTGAYEVTASNDIKNFEPENIKQFDIIILNNTCSEGKKRDMFLDITKDEKKAAELEKNLINHIAAGNGLVVLHGAIVMQNNSMEFSRMCGGSFDRHPAQQEVTCNMVDPDHPLVKVFKGKPLVHVDEPYLFNNAYSDMNFRPLMEMDMSKISGCKDDGTRRYVAWIKKHGKGRVFFCSPSHNAQSFEKTELLQFILDGIQYAAGDLDCDDSPIGKQ